MDIQLIILSIVATIDFPTKAAISVPVRIGPSNADPITPYFLNKRTALTLLFEGFSCFLRRLSYHVLNLSNIKITGITVTILPMNPTIITIIGERPQTIPNG